MVLWTRHAKKGRGGKGGEAPQFTFLATPLRPLQFVQILLRILCGQCQKIMIKENILLADVLDGYV